MKKGRMEAFSDGVIAIIITIMVLELKTPVGSDFSALGHLVPVFLSYILSFVYLGIYWNNHHHLVMTLEKVTGSILWANLHLLFWLSLVPFVTAWMGQNQFASETLALYGAVMLMAAISYFILQNLILKQHGPNSALAKAIGSDLKGKISSLLYLVAIPIAFYSHWVSGGIYALIAFMWLVPDKRIERAIK